MLRVKLAPGGKILIHIILLHVTGPKYMGFKGCLNESEGEAKQDQFSGGRLMNAPYLRGFSNSPIFS